MNYRRIAMCGTLFLVSDMALGLQMELTRPELCSVAHRVVIGEVVHMHTQYTGADHRSIERVVQFAVEDTVLGPAERRVEVVLPGGFIGQQGHWVEDVPKLMVNGRYLLFIATAMDGKEKIIGGDQGAVRITPEGARIGETRVEAAASVEVCRAQD